MKDTTRRIPLTADESLSEHARPSGQTGMESGEHRKRRDLRDLVGTWQPDKAFEEALAAQDQIDEDLWK